MEGFSSLPRKLAAPSLAILALLLLLGAILVYMSFHNLHVMSHKIIYSLNQTSQDLRVVVPICKLENCIQIYILVIIVMFSTLYHINPQARLLPCPSPDTYLVLLDAGSVHTSIYTYRWFIARFSCLINQLS